MIRHGEFLKDEVLTGFQERGEGLGSAKKRADVGEALVEAADDVEDEGAVGDDLTEGREIIGHLLQLAAVSVMERSPWTKLRNCVSS